MNNIKLICIRHGETIHNSKNITQGWYQSELSEVGKKQVQECVDSINEVPQAIFYSDLLRCRQTTDILLKKFPDVSAFADWRLRERSFGALENKVNKDVDWNSLYSMPPDTSPYQSEPDNHFIERVRSFMRDMRFFGITEAVVVTHGGVINRFKKILNSDHSFEKHENAKVYIIEYSLDDTKLVAKPVPEWSIDYIKN
ncbi:MAG: histidine phosphatase family protein [Candidatus Saccharibacteria bacterium]